MIVLGCRKLEPYNFIPIQLPYVEFDIGSREHVADVRATKPSKTPTGANPNFLEVCTLFYILFKKN